MKKTVLGERTGEKFYLDLRDGWRIGDFAGIRMLLENWRRIRPDAHLTVTYGNHHWRSVHSNQLDLAWVFEGIADVVLEMEHAKDLIHNHIAMDGKPILGGVFSAHIWNDWARLREDVISKTAVLKGCTPPEADVEKAKELLYKK